MSVVSAWDRRCLLIKARRFSANGDLVICDRFPSERVGAMDSPRLTRNPNSGGIRISIYNYFARLEERLYRQIPPPDLILQLKVSLETAKKRNQDRIKRGKETDEYLESRHRQNKNWKISGKTIICDINTDQPLAETIYQVKKTIWDKL
jgi:thymidylate kinase